MAGLADEGVGPWRTSNVMFVAPSAGVEQSLLADSLVTSLGWTAPLSDTALYSIRTNPVCKSGLALSEQWGKRW